MRHQRPDDSQRASLHDELVDIVGRLLATLSTVERQARDMGRGFPTKGDGLHGSSLGSPVERLALNPSFDPAARAESALREFDAWLSVSRRLDRTFRGLLPAACEGAVVAAPSRTPRCESCGEVGEAGRFKMGRWCDPCYRRLLRRRTGAA